jgi:FlaA1/EpsC-like NDP-sugar epimerase
VNTSKNVIIVGAGTAGQILKADIERNYLNVNILGFIDDSISEISQSKTLGQIVDIQKIANIYKIDEILIAIPSANGNTIRKIILNALDNKSIIKIIPRSQKIINESSLKYEDATELTVEDLLGRPFVKKDIEILKRYYQNKTVFITGGAGSIGSEIVYQLLDIGINKIIVYDNSEYLMFNLDQRLKEKEVLSNKYKLILGNILNKNKVDQIIQKEKPDFIFHVAAYKHVYLMEDNVDEAVTNNVIGTKNIVDLAIKNEVENFVFISTDKVVNPTSIMGATKKLAEFYIKNKRDVKTKFNIVRFGNVINSNGSVLPLFEYQIKKYKYITITHKDIMRYFMSIREAAQLIISSITKDSNGEIYILDMGEIIKVYEIALCLIRIKNLIPYKDVKINLIGLKKGEKMIEELFTKEEMENLIQTETEIDNVFQLKNYEECVNNINQVFKDFEEMILNNHSQEEIKIYFKKLFPSLLLEVRK